MALNTPDRAPPVTANMSVRRSFSLPARIAASPKPSPTSPSSADGIETLFICASTKIVSFTASGAARRPSPSRRPHNNDDKPRLIPWTSPTKRTLAVGVLRIYRVTASNVSFLNSGTLLHTIFPKSQCWCVDGESIFVLRIRQDSYYRIELPFETEEDKGTVEQFQAVLGQVLQYERTPCPFKRGFEVELPERPKTPPRRRPKKQPEKAKKWLFDKTWVPEDGPRPSTPVLEGSDSGTTSSYEEDDRSSVCTDRSETVLESPGTVLDITPPRPLTMPSVSERAKVFQRLRSVTAPMDTDASASKPYVEAIPEAPEEEESQGTLVGKPPTERHTSSDTLSSISTIDSFHSLEASAQDSPSPPYLDAEAGDLNPWAEEHSLQQEEPRGRGKHRRQISDITVKSPSVGRAEPAAPVTPTTTTPTTDVHPSSAPSTPPLLISDSDDEDNFEPPFMDVPTPPTAIRMRKLTGASQIRAFSPMPHPRNIICPPRVNQRGALTAVLIRRTCELVLGPPAHLVSLMLHIAARISNGFGFNTYRVRNTGEKKIPCSWESSDEDEWVEEDDFGIPLNNLDDSRLRRRRPACGELD